MKTSLQASATGLSPSSIRSAGSPALRPKAVAIFIALVPLICGALSVSAQQKPVVLRGGNLLTVTHGRIANGVLVMENGKIAALGPANAVKIPRDAKVADVAGLTIYPGLIDSETTLGLTEISAEQSTNDLIEMSDEIMPHMHVYDAFHAESE